MPTTIINNNCSLCSKPSSVEVPTGGYEKFLSGVLVQNALPTLSAGDREIILTGIHSECWDEMFAEDEEDL